MKIGLLFSLLFILSACMAPADESFEDPTAGITITAEQNPTTLSTTFEKLADLSEYKVGSTNVSPNVYMGENYIYAAHRYPEKLLAGVTEITDEIGAQFYTEEILVYDYDWNEVKRIPLDWKDTGAVNVSGLCVDEESGEIHLYSSVFGLHRYVFDAEGSLTGTEDLPDNIVWDTTTYELTPDSVYYRVKDEIYADWFGSPYQDIYRYDLESGQTELLLTGVSDFTLRNETIVYLKCDGREDGSTYLSAEEKEEYKGRMYELFHRNLYTYDPTDETHTLLAPFHTENRALYIRLSVDGRTLYHGNYENLYAYSLETGESDKVMESTNLFVPGTMRNGLLPLGMGSSQVSLYKVPAEPVGLEQSRTALVFAQYLMGSTPSTPNEDIFGIVRQNGWNAAGEWGYTSTELDEYTNTMAKKLLAGDTDFDIFYVTTEMSQLFESPYYEDLSRYSLMNGYYDHMQPGAETICSIDGIPCLVPVDLYTFMNRIDTSVLSGEYILPRTLEEFIQFKDSVTLETGSYLLSANRAFVLFQPLFEQFAANFMNRTVADRQAEQDLIFLYETVYSLMNDNSVYLGEGGTRRNHAMDFVQNRGSFQLGEHQTVLPVLKISEDYGETWHGGFYAVNPNSPNKELAIIFLACMIENQLDIGLEVSQLYNTGTDASDEVAELFLQQLADGVRGYQVPDFKGYLREQFEKIETGAMTPADAAEEMQRYLKMVRDE